MNIVEEIKKFVEEECKKDRSKYGYEPFPFHFVPVAKYALELARELGGDLEVVELAAYLHDIGSIVNGREDHHETGAEIAEKKLTELGLHKNKIKLVKKCVLNHRGSKENNRETIEEKIIAEADTMSHFDNISGIFKAAFIYENLDQKKAQAAVREKLKRKYNQLHFEKSKKIIKPKYEAAMLLLK